MVEKFDSFDVIEGKLIGKVGKEEYEIEQILNVAGKRTEVTYYDGDELVTMVQSESGKYVDSIAERYARSG